MFVLYSDLTKTASTIFYYAAATYPATITNTMQLRDYQTIFLFADKNIRLIFKWFLCNMPYTFLLYHAHLSFSIHILFSPLPLSDKPVDLVLFHDPTLPFLPLSVAHRSRFVLFIRMSRGLYTIYISYRDIMCRPCCRSTCRQYEPLILA